MSSNDPCPPRFLILLARLLRGGDQGRLIREDLDESFVRDLERRIPLRRARRRYTLNVLGSIGASGRPGSLACWRAARRSTPSSG